MSLVNMLPAPSRTVETFESLQVSAPGPQLHVVPPYLKRKGFIPRKSEDFGDGGAFPEIHVSQYPLNMGRPKAKSGGTSSAIVAVDVDADGEVKYDAIVRQGTNRDRTMYTSLKDMKAKEGDEKALALPTQEDEAAAAEKTRAALEGIIGAKVAAARPFAVPAAAHTKEAKFIQYTPNPHAPGVGKQAKQRIIRMVEEQVDPLEPAKFANKKVPRGPPEDPTPILHSPARKTTVADQQAWKIPPCISNWKNVGGFTIPLDKRLAADGRGLQEQTINNNFATLSESLYIAERKAREELESRAKILHKLKAKEKDQKETELREIAAKARMQRAGVDVGGDSGEAPSQGQAQGAPLATARETSGRDLTEGRRDNRPAWMVERDDRQAPGQAPGQAEGQAQGGDDRRGSRGEARGRDRGYEREERRVGGRDDEGLAMDQRDKMRTERRKEREREMRMENMKGEFKRSKHERERERDVSEKVALGLAAGAPKLVGEQQFDSRLFNQSEGMSSGFGNEDEYNVYSKALFDRGEAASVYRPSKSALQEAATDGDSEMEKLGGGGGMAKRFKPDKGFRGADAAEASARDGPVQFSKEQGKD